MNSPVVNLRLPQADIDALDSLAHQEGITRSAIIQRAIAALLTPQPLLESLGISQADQEALEALATRQGCTVANLINIATMYYIDYHKGLGTVHQMLKQLKMVLTDTAIIKLPVPDLD